MSRDHRYYEASREIEEAVLDILNRHHAPNPRSHKKSVDANSRELVGVATLAFDAAITKFLSEPTVAPEQWTETKQWQRRHNGVLQFTNNPEMAGGAGWVPRTRP